jgi:hypothetical protein
MNTPDPHHPLTAEERLQLIDRVMRKVFDATESWAVIGPGLAYWAWAVTDHNPESAWVDWRNGHEEELLCIFRELFPPDQPENANVWRFIRT